MSRGKKGGCIANSPEHNTLKAPKSYKRSPNPRHTNGKWDHPITAQSEQFKYFPQTTAVYKYDNYTLLKRCTLQVLLDGERSFTCEVLYLIMIVYNSFRYDSISIKRPFTVVFNTTKATVSGRRRCFAYTDSVVCISLYEGWNITGAFHRVKIVLLELSLVYGVNFLPYMI